MIEFKRQASSQSGSRNGRTIPSTRKLCDGSVCAGWDTNQPLMREGTSLLTVLKTGPLKITIIGSGNWGSSVSRIIGRNAKESYLFDESVRMWVFEEMIDGKQLSKIINEKHENPKYLPGIALPPNVFAVTDILEAVVGADLLIFCLPHQFVLPLCRQLASHVKPTAKAISLIKGLHVENGQPCLFSSIVHDVLGIDCCVLSGANVAADIAREQFSETTIGYEDEEAASIFQQLFDVPYFRVNAVPDVKGVEVCGAVKNVVALSAGFVEGLGYGTNTRAAIIRIGLDELKLFACLFFDGVLEETFFDSAGFADLITTCFGGRNVKCAKEFVLRGCKDTWSEIERDLLGGQHMQGQLTCEEIFKVIRTNKLEDIFPLFTATYRIAFEGQDPKTLIDIFQSAPTRRLKKMDDCNGCLVPDFLAAAKQRLTHLAMQNSPAGAPQP